MRAIGIGDPVRVQFVRWENRSPHLVWKPATVCVVNHGVIGVAYADGTREMLSHGRIWEDARQALARAEEMES